jgi:hypothetical protein
MTIGHGPFSVYPERISSLGPAFATFVNILLDVETAVAGMSGHSLITTYRENLGDGGVDAGISRATETRWIPAGDSAWQFKAGDKTPAKCEQELRGAIRAQEVLNNGGKYFLVLGAGLNDNLIKTRRERLLDTARDLGIDVDEDSITVLDATALSRWAEEHPSVAAWPELGGIGPTALTFSAWSASIRHRPIWVPSESRGQLAEQIRQLVEGDDSDLRIEGVSGLGKTRSVLEAMRGAAYEPLVVYLPTADDVPPGLIYRNCCSRAAQRSSSSTSAKRGSTRDTPPK